MSIIKSYVFPVIFIVLAYLIGVEFLAPDTERSMVEVRAVQRLTTPYGPDRDAHSARVLVRGEQGGLHEMLVKGLASDEIREGTPLEIVRQRGRLTGFHYPWQKWAINTHLLLEPNR